MQLQGKRIVVTGAARGIGAAAVRAFVAEGAEVAALDVQHGEPSASHLNPGRVACWTCDIADADAVRDTFDEAAAALGGLDVLVNVAGVISMSGAESIPHAEWDRVMAINATGTFLTNQYAFPYLRSAGGGSIINFASIAGVRGYPGGAHYAASKGAVLGWTRTVADEWGPLGIRVNAVAPSVWTPMYDGWRSALSAQELADHDVRQRVATPLGGKLGDPDRDLAPLLVFLAGDGSRFMTGQTIAVDGGKLKLS